MVIGVLPLTNHEIDTHGLDEKNMVTCVLKLDNGTTNTSETNALDNKPVDKAHSSEDEIRGKGHDNGHDGVKRVGGNNTLPTHVIIFIIHNVANIEDLTAG